MFSEGSVLDIYCLTAHPQSLCGQDSSASACMACQNEAIGICFESVYDCVTQHLLG